MDTEAALVDRDAGRLSLLYRLGIPAQACRILEISAASAPILRGSNWAGCTVTHREPASFHRAAEFPSATGAFDAIVLHRAFDKPPLLFDLLRPGGIIAGCVENSRSLTRFFGGDGTGAPIRSPRA